MKRVLTLAVAALLCCGCECFLPPGEAPEGKILENAQQGRVSEIRDRRQAVDHFINELIRETLLHAPGEAVKLIADEPSKPAAQYIILKAGEISGIRAAEEAGAGCTLTSSYRQGEWVLQLDRSGRMLWRGAVRLR